MRRENENAASALKTAQAAAQQRVLERDSYFLTVEELEQNHLNLQQQYIMEATIIVEKLET